MIALQWQGQVLSLLDQTKYPQEESWITCDNVKAVAETLSSGVIPDEKIAAIAGAYGFALAALEHQDKQLTEEYDVALNAAADLLMESRKNHRDMAHAMNFMKNPPEAYLKNADRLTAILATAVTYERQHVVASRNICRNGTDMMSEGTRVLVRADGGVFHSASPWGALGIARRGVKRGQIEQLAILEGRPSLAAATVTAQELTKEEIPFTLIPDHAAATYLARQGAHVVLADGILAAKSGDLKAPVGTYELAIACYFHSIPFYAVMNSDDIDLEIPNGTLFGTEEGDPASVTEGLDCGAAKGWTPAYDVVPAFLITGFITDRTIACAPYEETLEELIKYTPKKMIVDFNNLG